jgi:hypothetical protein
MPTLYAGDLAYVHHHGFAEHARAAVEQALRTTGFTVRVSRRYGAYTLPPRRLAFFARKRG